MDSIAARWVASPGAFRDRSRPTPAALRRGLLRRRWGLTEPAARTIAALAFGEEGRA